jgi:MFS transporter, Spinster family, sphingosine-1-phosphate transporter
MASVLPPQAPLPASRPGATLAVLTGLNALNYLDRFMVAPLLPLIIISLGLSDRQAGSLQSAFILVYAIACPGAGWIGDRHARLRMAALGVMVWSLATVGSGIVATFGGLLLARAAVGIGEASYSVITPSIISDHYPADKRARALSIFYAAMPFGIAIGYVMGGQIGARYGWRPAFFVAGGPGILLACMLLLLREPTRGRLDGVVSSTRNAPPLRDFWRTLKQRPSYFVNMSAQTFYTFTMGGLGAWMPTYFVRERHLGVAQAGTLFGGLLLAAGFVGTLLGGVVGDRLAVKHRGAHFTFSAVTLLASLPFTVAAIVSATPWLYWSAMGLSLFCLFLNYGPLNAAMVNVLPSHTRARGVGLHTTTIHVFGDAFSPFLIGAASDAIGLRIPVLATGLLVALSAALLLAGRGLLVKDLNAVDAAIACHRSNQAAMLSTNGGT